MNKTMMSNDWLYRRDNRVRRELNRVFMRYQDIPCLSPEVVLLYKSKAPRSHDEMDLIAALPYLGREQRSWLGEALETSAPGHSWIQMIMRREGDVSSSG